MLHKHKEWGTLPFNKGDRKLICEVVIVHTIWMADLEWNMAAKYTVTIQAQSQSTQSNLAASMIHGNNVEYKDRLLN